MQRSSLTTATLSSRIRADFNRAYRPMRPFVILRYSEGSTGTVMGLYVASRSFGVPQDDNAQNRSINRRGAGFALPLAGVERGLAWRVRSRTGWADVRPPWVRMKFMTPPGVEAATSCDLAGEHDGWAAVESVSGADFVLRFLAIGVATLTGGSDNGKWRTRFPAIRPAAFAMRCR